METQIEMIPENNNNKKLNCLLLVKLQNMLDQNRVHDITSVLKNQNGSWPINFCFKLIEEITTVRTRTYLTKGQKVQERENERSKPYACCGQRREEWGLSHFATLDTLI